MRIQFIFFLLLGLLSISYLSVRGQVRHKPEIWDAAGPILFLGNSITYSGQYVAMTESLLLTSHPKKSPMFCNLGLPSETVSGLSEPNHADGKFPRPCLFDRLDHVLDKIKPEVVFVCYGMNDGIYLPFDSSRFEAYKVGILRLHERLQKAEIKRIIWLTPPVHDDLRLRTAGYNQVLDRYADWLMAEAVKNSWEIIDLHFPMKGYLEQQIKVDSTFKLATDGVHPGTLGHWLMAKAIIAHLLPKMVLEPTWDEQLSRYAKLERLYPLVLKRQTIMKDAWLTHTGHKRPGMTKGLPMAQAYRLYQEIKSKIADL
ncbi:SGNH/GDSL hydrolase family protein [Sphingobacterium sp. arapr2]|nr:SGNH/GDSL hydrolase family protein [Sphingobacterium prati]NPE48405.1 SGNH/GDSL hydrolase family protein [Sphingobacterium prati]